MSHKGGWKGKGKTRDKGSDPFPTQRPDWLDEEQASGTDKQKGKNANERPGMANVVSPFEPNFQPSLFPENDGVPDHVGPVKKLHSKTGYNLAIVKVDEENILKVKGLTDAESEGDDVLQLTSEEVGEVKIMGHKSKHFVAMDRQGKVYPEPDRASEATVFYESFHGAWTIYKSKLNEDRGWYLGIKKSGKAKRGHRTALGQKATLFVPRPVRNAPS